MDTKLQESIEYLSQYISVTPIIQEKIVKHAKRYNIAPEICAWYSDWEDFCSDWCEMDADIQEQKLEKYCMVAKASL